MPIYYLELSVNRFGLRSHQQDISGILRLCYNVAVPTSGSLVQAP